MSCRLLHVEDGFTIVLFAGTSKDAIGRNACIIQCGTNFCIGTAGEGVCLVFLVLDTEGVFTAKDIVHDFVDVVEDVVDAI